MAINAANKVYNNTSKYNNDWSLPDTILLTQGLLPLGNPPLKCYE